MIHLLQAQIGAIKLLYIGMKMKETPLRLISKIKSLLSFVSLTEEFYSNIFNNKK